MKFGRAGVIAVATRKKNNLYGDQENSVARNTILSEYQKQCLSDKRKILKIHQFPLGVWLVGCAISIIGFYLLYHISCGNQTKILFQGFQEGYWWQYILASVIIFLGVSFIFAIKSEKITFDSSVLK